jgi:Rod binding domain-containing protein
MKSLDPASMTIKTRGVEPLAANSSPKAIRKQAADAAEQFETLMALQMVRGMQSSLEGGSMFGGGVAGDIYSGLAEWELARVLAHSSGFGLKEQILRQLPGAEESDK